MRIQFNGAAQDVTGSQFLIEVNGHRLLIDCGMYQGRQAYERNVEFRFEPKKVQAAILTHAHIDHSGNLPTLVKAGYGGPIYATPATADLADLMLRDSGHIQEDDAEFINKRRLKRGDPPILPLYTSADAARVKEHFRPTDYKQPFEPVPGVKARLFDAGHILGSASVCLDVKENGRAFRVWFSGDIGRLNLPLLVDPTLPEDAQYLVMECTYGDTVHPHPDEAYKILREVVTRTIKRGGKVIIPAFAVGRTQELVYNINRMMTAGDIPAIPVVVDSPLAVGATGVFQDHPELFDQETQDFIRAGRHPALNFNQLRYIDSRDESRALNEVKRPMVIISASGMAQNGRILHHLLHNLDDARNTIVFAGWQAPGTNGRELIDGASEIEIFGETVPVAASVVNITGFSAHAGQDYLLKYAAHSRGTLEKLVLVHGDPDVMRLFAEKLRQHGIRQVLCPDLFETIEL